MEFNALRFHTGSLWTIYIIIKLTDQPLNWNYLWLLMAPFFHFALIVPAFVFFLVKLFKPSSCLLLKIAVVSTVIQFLPVGTFDFFSADAGYEYYLSAERNNSVYDGSGIGRFFYLPLMLLLIFGIVKIYKNRKYCNGDLSFLQLGLYSIIIFNVVSLSAEYISRYKHIMVWFCSFPILYYWKKYKISPFKCYEIGIPIALFLFVFDLFYQWEAWLHWDTLFFGTLYDAYSLCANRIDKIIPGPGWVQ